MGNIRRPRVIPELSAADMCRWWRKVWIGRKIDCWIWFGARTMGGYGQLWLGGHKAAFLAHRIGYRMFRGKIPRGRVLMHLCDNPSCVNPRHLKSGSYEGNTWKMIEKGRQGGCVEVVHECPF